MDDFSLKEKLLELESKIIKLSDEFISYKKSAIIRNQCIDKKLEDEIRRQWKYIKSEELLFENI